MMRVRSVRDVTLYMVATQYGNMEVVVAMEKVVGCSPLAVNEYGCTALHRAEYGGQSELVRYLSNKLLISNYENQWKPHVFVLLLNG